jgi:hypothetical protein
MLIAIPSKSRFNLSKSTLRWIPRTLIPEVRMFVPAEEADRYKRAAFNTQYPIHIIPSTAKGIAEERHNIGQYAAQNGYEKFCMLDDDLNQFSARIAPYETPLRKATEQDCIEMFTTIEQYLSWFAHASVSPRFHNNAYVGDDPVMVNCKRMLRFLAYRTKEFLECEHGRVEIAEDFDVTLQLLSKGYKNAVLYKWCQDQSETGSAGGCSTYRTTELHNRNMLKMHELWPRVTQLREKKNISETAVKAGLSERLEITIHWEKAYRPPLAEAAE